MEYKLSGNSYVFCLFVVSNLLLMIIGLGTLTAGLYVCIDAENFNWYDGSFGCAGLVLVIVAIIGYRTKYSSDYLLCYLILVFFLFLIILGFAVATIVESSFQGSVGKTNAEIVKYSLVGGCGVIICCWVMGLIYRRSLLEVNFYHRNKPTLSLAGKGPLINQGIL